MGNKTRKDGAFKGERTRLAGRGEERKIGGGKKKKRKANPRRRRRVAPRGSFCLRSSSSSTFPCGVITTTNDAFTSI